MSIIVLVAATQKVKNEHRTDADKLKTYVCEYLKHAKTRLSTYGNIRTTFLMCA